MTDRFATQPPADSPVEQPGNQDPPPVEPLDPIMLADALEALTQRQHALERTIDTIWRRLGTPIQHGPWTWHTLPPDRQRELLTQLRDWVDWLIHRYDLRGEHHAIPPCWYAHPVAVEELTALMVAWQAAYTPEDPTPNDAPINWHDRWLWPTLHRLNTQLAVWRKCTAGTHQPSTARPPQTDPDGFTQLLHRVGEKRRDNTVAAMPDVALSRDQVERLLFEGDTQALLPDDPLSPISHRGQWYAIPANSPTDRWHPVQTDHATQLEAMHQRLTAKSTAAQR